jgi:hypothetical protein
VRALAIGVVIALGFLATRTGLAVEPPAEGGPLEEPPPGAIAELGPLPAAGIAGGADLGNWPAPDVARQLDDYARLNATWIRHDFAWDAVEPSPGEFSWAGLDELVDASTARGIRVIATIGYTPSWANGGHDDHRFGPSSATQFAAFAGAVAARYGERGVRAYEIWNEPNITYWQPEPDPAAYTRVLCAAYDAIKAVDPDAVVISGGVSPAGDGPGTVSPHAWLRALYAAGAKPCFDAIGVHPYVDSDVGAHSVDPGNPWFQMAGSTPSVRSIQADNDDSAKRLWATEVGARLSAGGALDQARRLDEALTLWRSYPWAGVLAWFIYWDPNEYGLVNGDWSPRPAWFAYRDAAAAYREDLSPD